VCVFLFGACVSSSSGCVSSFPAHAALAQAALAQAARTLAQALLRLGTHSPLPLPPRSRWEQVHPVPITVIQLHKPCGLVGLLCLMGGSYCCWLPYHGWAAQVCHRHLVLAARACHHHHHHLLSAARAFHHRHHLGVVARASHHHHHRGLAARASHHRPGLADQAARLRLCCPCR
jgi:hypothetical protein